MIERSQPDDAAEYARWMWENRAQNCASPESLRNCAVFKISGILHLPVKTVLMLESLAPNPEVTGHKRLLAIRRAITDLRKLYPHSEMVFLTKGDTALDEAAKFYGFTEMPFKVYRMRPDDKSRAAQTYRPKVAVEDSLQSVT